MEGVKESIHDLTRLLAITLLIGVLFVAVFQDTGYGATSYGILNESLLLEEIKRSAVASLSANPMNSHTWTTDVDFLQGVFAQTEVISGTGSVTLLQDRNPYIKTRINDDTSTSLPRQTPSLAVDANGVLYAAWCDGRNGNADIYIASSIDGGASWGPNVKVNDDIAATQCNPALAAIGDGRLYVVWEDYRNSNGDIYGATSMDGGETWSPNFKINDDSGSAHQVYPAIALDENSVYVVWKDHRSGADIYLSTSSLSDPTTWTPNIRVNDVVAEVQSNPSIVVDSQGMLLVAWEDYRALPMYSAQIFAARSTDGGGTWSPGVKVNDDTAYAYHGSPVLAHDGNGHFYAAWFDFRNGHYDIYIAKSVDGGASWGANVRINEDPNSSDQTTPALSAAGDGLLYVVWQDNDDFHVYFTNSVDGGATWSAGTKLDHTGFYQYNPTLVVDQNRRVVVAFEHRYAYEENNIYSVAGLGDRYYIDGVYTSAPYDAGSIMIWNNLVWTTTLHTGTSITFTARAGNTPMPDANWSMWDSFVASPADLSVLPSARYFQWQAHLSSSIETTTPVLEAVTLWSSNASIIAPTDLRATPASTSQINLIWTDNSDNEDSFRIERAPTAGGNWTQIATVNANITTYQDIGLDCGTVYYYRVRAHNADGDSDYSNTTSATTVPCAPILNAISNPDDEGNYTVSWITVTGAFGYTLQEATHDDFMGAVIVYSGSGASAAICGKSQGTYYYRIKAFNGTGDSGWSNTQSVTITAPPSAPMLNPVVNSDGDGNYTVSWSSVSGATSYILQEATNSAFTDATTAHAGSNTSTTISGNAPGTYYYRVRASNASGDGDWSNTQSATVVVAPTAPTLNPIANSDGDGNYTVSWSSVSGAMSYVLQEATNSTFTSAVTVYSGSNISINISNRMSGTYYYRARATNIAGNSPWSNTRSVVVSVAPGDPYEPDDNCTQARAIPNDGVLQERTFHRHTDEDWVVFTATAGETYRIEGYVPVSSPTDVNVEVYDACVGDPLDHQHNTFSPGVRLEFTAPADGPLYLRWFNHDPTVYGAEAAYHVSVQALSAQATPGAVIIVAGRDRYHDPLQNNIHYAAGQVYQMFQNNGYPADRIYYLSTDLTQPGANAQATVSNLEAAITTWTLGRVDEERPLTLYLVDHGMPNRLYLDKPAGEWVTPAQLDTWLAQVEAARPGLHVNVFVEACYAGSFIGLPQSLSQAGRVVVASTGATNLAYASTRGAIFSDHFSAALNQGASVYGAFESARGATQSAYPYQTPWLDANGNSIPNEAADAQTASLRGFAYAGTLSGDQWPPYIAQTTPVAVTGGRGNLRVEVRDDDAVRYVWAVIYPPSYTPPATQEELVQETLPTAMLLSQGNGWYGAQYTGFNEMGEYRVVFYAEDDLGLSAQPVAIMVRTGWAVYLPVVVWW